MLARSVGSSGEGESSREIAEIIEHLMMHAPPSVDTLKFPQQQIEK